MKCCEVLRKAMKINEFKDVWRIISKDKEGFTWVRQRPKIIKESLDMFLAVQSLIQMIARMDNYPSFCTDHSMIVVTLEMSSHQRGPGFWKLNTQLLHDGKHVNQVNQEMDQVLREQFKDVRTKWDFLKYKVKTTSQRYSINKRKARKTNYRYLNIKLKYLMQAVKIAYSPVKRMYNKLSY